MTNFRTQIRVDCTADPLNPMPVAQAVWREIARLRAQDNKPILVLSGEDHSQPAIRSLPYAFLRCSGLYNGTAPQALQTGFVFSLEMNCKWPSYTVERYGAHPVSPAEKYPFLVNDASGHRQVQTCLTAYTENLPHVFHSLFSAVDTAGVKFLANDLARSSSPFDCALFLLDQTDLEVNGYCRRVLGEGKHRLKGYDVRGMQIRNLAAADKLRAQLTNGAVVWHQCGLAHVYGQKDVYPYSQSFAGLFNRMAKRGDIHLLYVVPEHTIMPKQRYIGAGIEICAVNLSRLTPEEWAFRNQRPKAAMELQILASIQGCAQPSSVWLQNLVLMLTTAYRDLKLNRVDIPRWNRADKKVAQRKHS
jgi:hypothetical protein